jgi:hypothetical protein
MKNEKINIALISELHFTTWTTLKLGGYRIYIIEHASNRAHGETAVMIKETIKHYELDKHLQEHLQATSVHINDGNNDLTISVIYYPPRHKVDDKKFIDLFKTLCSRFIAGGDYNAKHTFWESRLITTKGWELFKSANTIKAQFFSTRKPTY